MSQESKGIVTCATGDKFRNEVSTLIDNLGHIMPNIPVTVFTDRLSSELESKAEDIRIIEEPYHNWGDKITTIIRSNYDLNLFVDSDTYICHDVTDLFQLLARVDIACAFEPSNTFPSYEMKGPQVFPEFNTGVILFRQCSELQHLSQTWLEIFESDMDDWAQGKKDRLTDQPSFREALWLTDIELMVLPTEFNVRFMGFVQGSVRILHGRYERNEKSMRKINKEAGEPRIFAYEKQMGLLVYPISRFRRHTALERFMQRIRKSLAQRGFLGVLKRAWQIGIHKFARK